MLNPEPRTILNRVQILERPELQNRAPVKIDKSHGFMISLRVFLKFGKGVFLFKRSLELVSNVAGKRYDESAAG